MHWIVKSVLACGAVVLVTLALLLSMLVVIAFVPGDQHHTAPTQPRLHRGVGRIAFAGDSLTGARDIFIMNADGSGQVNLTNSPETDTGPSWSPDGTQIVFTEHHQAHRRILSTNLNGVTTTLVHRGWSPTWSPDGEHIAFVSDQHGTRDLYLVSADGSRQHRLTNSDRHEGHPIWSPDGQSIAFSTGSLKSVYIINADGSNQQKLGEGDSPTWSPDSAHIAFSSAEVGVGIQITDRAGDPVRTINGGVRPLWSPDGTHIAFLTKFKDSLGASLGVVDADGSNQRILVEDIPWWTGVRWSPDGQWLVFTSGLSLHPEYAMISVIHVDGSDQTLLANGGFPVWQPLPPASSEPQSLYLPLIQAGSVGQG